MERALVIADWSGFAARRRCSAIVRISVPELVIGPSGGRVAECLLSQYEQLVYAGHTPFGLRPGSLVRLIDFRAEPRVVNAL
jgi:hypothetical protein